MSEHCSVQELDLRYVHLGEETHQLVPRAHISACLKQHQLMAILMGSNDDEPWFSVKKSGVGKTLLQNVIFVVYNLPLCSKFRVVVRYSL